MGKSILRSIDAISEWTGKCTAFILLPGIVILAWEVVSRYALNHPTMWAHGSSQRLFAVYYVLGGAYVLRNKDHVGVDIIYNRFSLRTKAVLDLVTSFAFFIFCGVLLWQGVGFAMTSLSQLEPDDTPWRAPVYPIKLMLPVGAFLILLQGLANFCRTLITVISGRECEY
ncbi:MAG: TRAP transporter small permease subunit [Deltaproteobacteria bacterium]|nr:MAG: TRAP transporter small permease subunit [Deltaproteobacteria bacterium]